MESWVALYLHSRDSMDEAARNRRRRAAARTRMERIALAAMPGRESAARRAEEGVSFAALSDGGRTCSAVTAPG
jgi:hypothetical protein